MIDRKTVTYSLLLTFMACLVISYIAWCIVPDKSDKSRSCVFSPGSRVLINEIEIEGTIVSKHYILSNPIGGHEVRYFSNGICFETVFYENEISKIK